MQVETIQVSPIGTNCYLLCDDKTRHCGIIDPGGDARRIIAAVEESGFQPVCILLTHAHYDHTGGVAGLVERWPDLPVYVSAKDLYSADDRKAARLFPPLEGHVMSYDEGEDVKVGQINVHVLSTPGHTKGSVTLLFYADLGRFTLNDSEGNTIDKQHDIRPGIVKLVPAVYCKLLGNMK